MSAALRVRITIQLGDLTRLAVDAIVNPANASGAMGGGVAKAIRDCHYVLHAPTMVRAAERSSTERIRQATLAALQLAEQHALARIAFPGMGTGVGKVPKSGAARAMIETIRAFPARHLKEVILVDRDRKMVEAWEHASVK